MYARMLYSIGIIRARRDCTSPPNDLPMLHYPQATPGPHLRRMPYVQCHLPIYK